MTHTRRDALRILGAGAALTGFAGSLRVKAGDVLKDPPTARFFALADVRLAQGPFLAAQKLDESYLLALEPDRMLHNFRVNAGLTPKAPVYGGWESVEPWIEIRCHGHTLGHYLSAVSCMYASTGDARFAQRVDYIVGELAECQAKTGGWLTAFPDGVAPLTDSLAGKSFAGVPWYTTHKVLAGLRDAHLHRGSKAARDVLVKFADWIDTACAQVPEDRLQKMLDREHGGMNEIFADLFDITGEPRYRTLAFRFSHRALLEPLANSRDTLNGLHANTQIPKVVGFSRIAEVAYTTEYAKAAQFFWRSVVEDRSFATGGHGDGEHFFPKDEFPKHLHSGKTMETCCTHNMLRLTRSLYARGPQCGYFDYFERALYNGILASQDPESGMMTYFQSTRPGYVRLYHTPFDSFWCCTGSGLENHARYGENIFAHDDDSLYVNLFIPADLTWKKRRLTIRQETRFPDADTTRLTITGGEPQKFALAIRQPSWCAAMAVTLNGRKKQISRRPGEYFRLTRTFRAGDVIEVRVPMNLHLEPLPHAADYAALMYGPIVLGARLGTQGLSPGSQLIVNERESGNMLNDKIEVPQWNRPLAELPANTKRTSDDELRFTAAGFDGGKSVELIPWFRLTHERYNLYWQGKPA